MLVSSLNNNWITTCWVNVDLLWGTRGVRSEKDSKVGAANPIYYFIIWTAAYHKQWTISWIFSALSIVSCMYVLAAFILPSISLTKTILITHCLEYLWSCCNNSPCPLSMFFLFLIVKWSTFLHCTWSSHCSFLDVY